MANKFKDMMTQTKSGKKQIAIAQRRIVRVR